MTSADSIQISAPYNTPTLTFVHIIVTGTELLLAVGYHVIQSIRALRCRFYAP